MEATGAHAQPNGGATTILTFGIFTFVASVTTALRFWARRILHLRPGLDDYLSVLLLLLTYGLLVVTVFAVILGGLGVADYSPIVEGDEQRTFYLFNVRHPFKHLAFWLDSRDREPPLD